MKKTMSSITDVDWKVLVGKIRKEKSILILEPEAFRSAENRPLLTHLLKELDLANNAYIQKYYQDGRWTRFHLWAYQLDSTDTTILQALKCQ